MKVAIVYNRVSQRVINLFGMPNREKYGLENINRIQDALRKARAESLREELGELQDYWSRKAKEQGILTEEDLQRYLES